MGTLFRRVLAVMSGALVLSGTVAWAQVTAFSYQGKLTDNGSPANGNYDMQFKLFDAVSAGAQQGATQVANPVVASAGVFTVTLDFGAGVFSGANRWLEIGVRPAGSVNPYSILATRQPVLASPYAIETINSQQLGGLPASRYLASTANGNFGIGVPNPTSRLEIAGQDGLAINGYQPFFTLRDTNAGNARSIIAGGNGEFGFYTNSSIGGNPTVSLRDSGRLGLSVPNPVHHLDINGGPSWTTNGWAGAIALTNASAIAWWPDAAGRSFGIGQTNGGLYVFNSTSVPGSQTAAANYLFQISDAGNAIMGLNGNGVVKAMLFINATGDIVRCYNGQSESTTVPCGFAVGRPATGYYDITFTFPIAARFFTASVFNNLASGGCDGGFPPTFGLPSAGSYVLRVTTGCIGSFTDRPFMVFVY